MVEAFCTVCSKTAYVKEGDDLVCPVCSSPLVVVATDDESVTG
jgi:uncharacterized Zn finger protein (UPF0148 family)